MTRFKPVNVKLTQEQQAEAERIELRLKAAFSEELKRLAQLMASKPNHQLFGQTEFELRDRMHALGAEVLEVTAEERVKKGGVIRELAASVPSVRGTLASFPSDRKHSSAYSANYASDVVTTTVPIAATASLRGTPNCNWIRPLVSHPPRAK